MGESLSRRRRRSFDGVYVCRSITHMRTGEDRSYLNYEGRIILPQSVLAELMDRQVETPMLFKLTNPGTDRYSHAGVLEFTADEPMCYMPDWMMKNLGIAEGSPIAIESVALRSAEFAQFEPQSPAFLDITDPKAILENRLRNFTCLTTGDIIGIHYNSHLYEMKVLQTRPDAAVCVIECDLNTDFAAPVGYKEPTEGHHNVVEDPDEANLVGFVPFAGTGVRLDGKERPEAKESISDQSIHRVRGIPDFTYVPGTIEFLRTAQFVQHPQSTEETEVFIAFQGAGQSLRDDTDTLKSKRSRTNISAPGTSGPK